MNWEPFVAKEPLLIWLLLTQQRNSYNQVLVKIKLQIIQLKLYKAYEYYTGCPETLPKNEDRTFLGEF